MRRRERGSSSMASGVASAGVSSSTSGRRHIEQAPPPTVASRIILVDRGPPRDAPRIRGGRSATSGRRTLAATGCRSPARTSGRWPSQTGSRDDRVPDQSVQPPGPRLRTIGDDVEQLGIVDADDLAARSVRLPLRGDRHRGRARADPSHPDHHDVTLTRSRDGRQDHLVRAEVGRGRRGPTLPVRWTQGETNRPSWR